MQFQKFSPAGQIFLYLRWTKLKKILLKSIRCRIIKATKLCNSIYLIVQNMIMYGINQERFSDTIIPLGIYFCISYWKVLINYD
ncbi:hypothetical protein T01_2287 [Trichinella spiralis]|uniref:Uncharacterized protein n=1 Tax=Trichinella spiralis TaxID=6334 RepID=A0A0V1C0M4_TRISP|nr:hypothetical protein T01_2287 [Trichinella spiralis]